MGRMELYFAGTRLLSPPRYVKYTCPTPGQRPLSEMGSRVSILARMKPQLCSSAEGPAACRPCDNRQQEEALAPCKVPAPPGGKLGADLPPRESSP